MKLKSLIRTTCAVAVLSAISAFADAKSEIVGKWSDTEGVETIEYKADGTFTETLAGGDVVKGKYSFPDATHIKTEFEGPMSAMGPVTSAMTLKGDTMEVTGADGSSVMKYNRVKADAAK